ncbi:MAG: phosphoglucosamine mutase, partial [Tenericutes bacterium HGW-Tenericutes-3]
THLLHSGDGLLVAIYLLKILSELNTTLEEFSKDVELYPYKLINIKGIDKKVLDLPSVKEKLKTINSQIGENSLLLVRPSGTESLIRVTMSLKDENLLNTLSKELVEFIQKEGKML